MPCQERRDESFSKSSDAQREGQATDQTCILAEEQCDSALSREEWKAVISSRATDVGSGRKSPAEREAFAMAI